MYIARNQKNKYNCMVLFDKIKAPIIIFDTETTGLNPEKDYIVELSAIKYMIKEGKLEEIDKIDLFLKPPFPMEQKVIDIHGITNERLSGEASEAERMSEIQDFFGSNPILIGHNVDFDVAMLNALYKRNHELLRIQIALDTLEMSRDLISYNEVSDYKLETLCNEFGVNNGLQFHTAIDDVKATARLLVCLYNDYKKTPVKFGGNRLYINYMFYKNGYNLQQRGVYLDTNDGRIYYNTCYKTWMSTTIDLNTIDIIDLENQVLTRTGLTSMKEFGRLTEKKFKELKVKRRSDGVYL